MTPPFEIGKGTSANYNRDGSISIYQENKVIHMKPGEAKIFKKWLDEVIPNGRS